MIIGTTSAGRAAAPAVANSGQLSFGMALAPLLPAMMRVRIMMPRPAITPGSAPARNSAPIEMPVIEP